MGKNQSSLDIEVLNLSRRAHIAEHGLGTTLYRPTFIVELTVKHCRSADSLNKAVRRYQTIVARKMAKLCRQWGCTEAERHTFWFGWYDVQPQRQGDSYHYHLFVEIEGIGFEEMDHLQEFSIKRILKNEWRKGIAEVERFDKSKGRIIYAARQHDEFIWGTGCSNGQRKCGIRDCYWDRHSNFIDRHKEIKSP